MSFVFNNLNSSTSYYGSVQPVGATETPLLPQPSEADREAVTVAEPAPLSPNPVNTLIVCLQECTIPVKLLASFVKTPGLAAEFSFTQQDKTAAWKSSASKLNELIAFFKTQPLDFGVFRTQHLITLFAANAWIGTEKFVQLGIALKIGILNAPYEIIQPQHPTLLVHNNLINGENYTLLSKHLNFKTLNIEEKFAFLKVCDIKLLIDPVFKSELTSMDMNSLNSLFFQALKLQLENFKGQQTFAWFDRYKHEEARGHYARLAHACAPYTKLCELALATTGKSIYADFFVRQLAIQKAVDELRNSISMQIEVEKLADNSQLLEALVEVQKYLQGYAGDFLCNGYHGHIQLIKNVSDDASSAVTSILLAHPEWLCALHWTTLIKNWRKIQFCNGANNEILTQLARVPVFSAHAEILHLPLLTAQDLRVLLLILPKQHLDRHAVELALTAACQNENAAPS